MCLYANILIIEILKSTKPLSTSQQDFPAKLRVHKACSFKLCVFKNVE